MLRNILLPVDGSPRSLAAVDCAVTMARAFHAGLCVMTVVDPFQLPEAGPIAVHAITVAHQMIHARGMSARTAIVDAHLIWKAILETAASGGADLVVMGSHGQSGLPRWVVGGVTQQVLQHATIPLLVVQDPERPIGLPVKARDVWRSVKAKSECLAQSHRRH